MAGLDVAKESYSMLAFITCTVSRKGKTELWAVAREEMVCGAKGRHARNNVLRSLRKEAKEELLQIPRGISFHIKMLHN